MVVSLHIDKVYTKIMLILISLLIIGSIMVYLSQNNLVPVSLHLGTYIFSGIPLFYIIIGSLLTGLGISYLLSTIGTIISGFKMRNKDSTIKKSNNDIVNLTKRIHQLELENERLKNNSVVFGPQDKNAL
jgi:lipopolysaccharide assembly protein A